MAKKIRVHELAKKLGMTNDELLGLCRVMGIGVKTNSSSLIEAAAERLARRAARDGLTRAEQPARPSGLEKPTRPAKAVESLPLPTSQTTLPSPVDRGCLRATPPSNAERLAEGDPQDAGYQDDGAKNPPANGDPPAIDHPSERRNADRRRIADLVLANEVQLRRFYGRWLVGEVLILIWENKAAMRIVRERGILLDDVARGTVDAFGDGVRLPANPILHAYAISELRRLRKARLAYLSVSGSDDDARLVVHSTDIRVSQARSRDNEQSDRRESVHLAVGMIAWVAVEELSNGRRSRKRHPALLLAPTGRRNDRWVVLTMTSVVPGDPQFRSVPGAAELGLHYTGYLWHSTTKVHRTQITNPVGWVHRDLVRAVDRTIGLRQHMRHQLEAIADLHHKPE